MPEGAESPFKFSAFRRNGDDAPHVTFFSLCLSIREGLPQRMGLRMAAHPELPSTRLLLYSDVIHRYGQCFDFIQGSSIFVPIYQPK